MELVYNRQRVLSENAGSHDRTMSIELTHPGIPLEKLFVDSIITDNLITSVEWGMTSVAWNGQPPVYNLKLNMPLNETIPFAKINKIIEYLMRKYNATYHSIILMNWNDDLDLTPLKYIPKRLSTRSCLFVNLKCSVHEVINITEFISDGKLPPLDISLEQCKNLNKLYISGEYTIGIDTLDKFKYLTNLEKLLLNNVRFGNYSNMHLPYLGSCTNLVKLNMSSINIPEMFEFESDIRYSVNAKKVVKLCRTLKSDPHNRLIDICLALWNMRLPSYVILWIINWLPHSDMISTETKTLYKLDKSYSDNTNYCKKIPKWIMSNYKKIELIRNVNERKFDKL